jgi:hypothetical protein
MLTFAQAADVPGVAYRAGAGRTSERPVNVNFHFSDADIVRRAGGHQDRPSPAGYLHAVAGGSNTNRRSHGVSGGWRRRRGIN